MATDWAAIKRKERTKRIEKNVPIWNRVVSSIVICLFFIRISKQTNLNYQNWTSNELTIYESNETVKDEIVQEIICAQYIFDDKILREYTKWAIGLSVANQWICVYFFSAFVTDYDEIGHLPDFDFTQRVHLLKKVHYDLSKSPVPKTSSSKRPKSRCKKKKCVKAKSAPRKICDGTPSTFEVGFC